MKSILSKILSRRTLLVVTLMGLVISIALLFYFIPKRSVQGDSPSLIKSVVVSPKQKQASFGLPVRLKIPGINVDATVQHVGLTSSGEMDAPKSPTDVAWLELGKRPGENGSAVITGHYGVWKNGEGSVFDDLKKLRQGDKLYIEDDRRAVIPFVVRESRSYDPEGDASDVFSSNDGKSHLNLITCEDWDEALEGYSKRLVVFTDKE